MKKVVIVLLISILCLPVFAGGGSDSATVSESGKVIPQFLEFYSGSQGGSWYQVGAQIANLAQEATGIPSKVAAGGGNANPLTLQSGDGYFGLVYSGVGYQAYKGEGDFVDNPCPDLNAVIAINYLPFLMVKLANDDSINTVYDLKDKDISLGKAGQTGFVLARAVLKAHGIDIDDPASFTGLNSMLGDSERMDLLRDRQLDLMTGLLPLDNGNLQSMSLSPGIELIGMDPAVIPQIQEEVPGTEVLVIPAGSFNENQTEDITTVSIVTSLYCRADLDDEIVYEVTKAIYENASSLYQYFGEDYALIPGAPLSGIDPNMPIHPGALKYYREIGIVE